MYSSQVTAGENKRNGMKTKLFIIGLACIAGGLVAADDGGAGDASAVASRRGSIDSLSGLDDLCTQLDELMAKPDAGEEERAVLLPLLSREFLSKKPDVKSPVNALRTLRNDLEKYLGGRPVDREVLIELNKRIEYGVAANDEDELMTALDVLLELRNEGTDVTTCMRLLVAIQKCKSVDVQLRAAQIIIKL